MSSKYRYGRLVKNEFLPEHNNNTWYYSINSYLFEFYSYNTMVGFIDFEDNVFYEWANYKIVTNIVTRKKGLSILKDKTKLKNFKKVVDK